MPLRSMTSLLSELNAAIFNASRVIPLVSWLLTAGLLVVALGGLAGSQVPSATTPPPPGL